MLQQSEELEVENFVATKENYVAIEAKEERMEDSRGNILCCDISNLCRNIEQGWKTRSFIPTNKFMS